MNMIAMKLKTWFGFVLLLVLVYGQNNNLKNWPNYERTNEWPSYSSLISDAYQSTSGASSLSGNYPDSSIPSNYRQYPGFDYESSEFNLEDYGKSQNDNFNISLERIGGFGGSGDTRGYGAYEYPKEDYHRQKSPIPYPELLPTGRELHQENDHLFIRPP